MLSCQLSGLGGLVSFPFWWTFLYQPSNFVGDKPMWKHRRPWQGFFSNCSSTFPYCLVCSSQAVRLRPKQPIAEQQEMYPALKQAASVVSWVLSAMAAADKDNYLDVAWHRDTVTKLPGWLQVCSVEQFYTRPMHVFFFSWRRIQILCSWLEGKWSSATGFPKLLCNPNNSGFDWIPVRGLVISEPLF